jgi:PAS domain S-box-containing protein
VNLSNYVPGIAPSKLRDLWALSFEKTTRGIAIIEARTRLVIAVNPAYAEMHGGVAADFVGETIDRSLTPDSVARLPDLARHVDATGFAALESEHVRLDGSVFPVATEAMAARDEEGNLLYRIAWFTDLTDRNRLQKQTREAERQLEDAFELAATGMALVGLDGRWLRANPALCEITGYEEAELQELTFSEITHRDDLAANFEGDEQLLQGEADSYRLEKRYIRKGGEAIWVLLAVSLAGDDDGVPSHYIVHVHDISLRKRIEEDLARETVGTELGRDLMCTIGFDGSFKHLEGRWQDVLGWSEEELRSRPMVDFVHPDDRGGTQASFERLSEKMDWFRLRNRWHNKGGDWTWLIWSAVVIAGEELVFCAVREANNQVAIEKALELRGEVIANMAEGVGLVTTADMRFVYANPSLERMLGYGTGELSGRDAAEVMRPTDLSPEEERVRLAAESELRRHGGAMYEGRRVRKDGREIWCRSTTTTFAHPRYGEVWVVVQQDITEERRAREAAADLERAKTEFLGSVSHELRTPLTSILGYTALLRADAGTRPGPIRDHIEVIERNASRQLRLVEDLLSIARIEAGEFEFRLAPTLLCEVVAAEAEAMRPDADAAELTLTVEIEGTLEVNGDADRLSQVLTNLIANAIKFTPAGGRIEIGLRREGDEALLSVDDTGPGTKASDLPHLFDRLYRGKAVRDRQTRGAGLGLAICRSIVEAHSGWIEAREGRLGGATFVVGLPLL